MAATVIGIDPSLSSTGVVIGSHPEKFHVRHFESSNMGNDVRGRIARAEDLVAHVMNFAQGEEISHVVMEGYSFSTPKRYDEKKKEWVPVPQANAKYLAEYRGILCFHLVAAYPTMPPIIEVAPLTLKKFATGKGKGGKNEIMRDVYKHWGVEFSNDDETDAYVLYRIGLCLNGYCQAETKAQAEVVKLVQKKMEEAATVPASF